MSDKPECLKFQVCPQCGKLFRLVWNDHTKVRFDDDRGQATAVPGDYGISQTLNIRGCPSGGVYDVSISCPHCDYEEGL